MGLINRQLFQKASKYADYMPTALPIQRLAPLSALK